MLSAQDIINEICAITNSKINKNILYYNINIIYFELFNIIKNKIEKIKILKYKNLVEYKEHIIYYNNFIKKFNLYIYGIKYDIFTIDLFKKKNINNINLVPEISPFKISHHIYKNIIRSKEKTYKIKGFICFIVNRKTSRQDTTKIYIFSNIRHKDEDYYVYDIREILNFISPQILNEIDILVKNGLNTASDDHDGINSSINGNINGNINESNGISNERSDERPDKDHKGLNGDLNYGNNNGSNEGLNYGINNSYNDGLNNSTKYPNNNTKCLNNSTKCLISGNKCPKDGINNHNIAEEDTYNGYLATISCDNFKYDKNDVIDMFNFYNDYVNTDIYINIYFRIQQFKKNTNKYNIININKDIFKNLTKIFYNLEYNDNYNEPGILLKNNNIYISSNSFIKSSFTNQFKINNDLSLKIILQYKDIYFKYITDFKSLLYSLNLDNNILYIMKHNEKIYTIDIYKLNKYNEKSELFNIIYSDYILKKNDIIVKKNISKSLEMLLKIDTNVIDWYDFIKNSEVLHKNVDLYDWFVKNYKRYMTKNYIESQQIFKSFKYLSLFDLFLLAFNDTTDFNDFILYYKKKYKIENKNIVSNGYTEKISKYDNFIDIIRIFLYLYNFN
jgi:hypothetical protein